MTELFPESEITQDSPQRKWMKEHGISVKFRSDLGSDWPNRWEAWHGDYEKAVGYAISYSDELECGVFVAAETREGAIKRLAELREIDDWTGGEPL